MIFNCEIVVSETNLIDDPGQPLDHDLAGGVVLVDGALHEGVGSRQLGPLGVLSLLHGLNLSSLPV